MGILAISEYIRHGKRNVFIVFQMAALLFLRQHFWRNTACIDHLRN